MTKKATSLVEEVEPFVPEPVVFWTGPEPMTYTAVQRRNETTGEQRMPGDITQLKGFTNAMIAHAIASGHYKANGPMPFSGRRKTAL